MKIENQVVSLELAKQLKELSVKQDSLFYWNRLSDTPDGREDWHIYNGIYSNGLACYSAFTVAELGEMLPWELVLNDEEADLEHNLFSEKLDTVYRVYYLMKFGGSRTTEFDAENEADARAKMLIWLIENNYAEIKKQEKGK